MCKPPPPLGCKYIDLDSPPASIGLRKGFKTPPPWPQKYLPLLTITKGESALTISTH